MIEVLKQALEALEKNYKLINGEGTRFGLEGAMDGYYSGCFDVDGTNKETENAITAIKEAIAELESQEQWGVSAVMKPEYVAEQQKKTEELRSMLESQEPVAWADHGVLNWIADMQFKHASYLYTHPPQRKPLTDEIVGLLKEARKIIRASSSRNLVKDWDARTTKAIAAHGIKE